MKRNRWLLALAKAEMREAEKAVAGKDYPRHTTGVARAAFVAGALWARRYLADHTRETPGEPK